MLFSPEIHEPLDQRSWSGDAARAAIRGIAADCEASFDSPYWPVHPRDVDGDEAAGPWTTLYLGSAGVVYALDLLVRRGLVDGIRDYFPALEQALERERVLAAASE